MTALARILEPEQPVLGLGPIRTADEWREEGVRLASAHIAVNWLVGDWWNAGEPYGDRVAEAARIFPHLSHDTMRKLGWIADKFNVCRRRHTLDWAAHAEVAVLAREEADELLSKAEAENLSTRDLRREVMAYRMSQSAAKRREPDRLEMGPGHEDEITPEMFTMDEVVIELAESLGKFRALSNRESAWLERSWRRLRQSFGRQTEEWDGGQDLQVKSMLCHGRSVREIADALERTPAALRRRINKLGGIRRLIADGSVAMPEAAE